MIPLQPLLILRTGAPDVRISHVRLLGGLKVEGGNLELTDCSIEPDDSSNLHSGGTRRLLNPSAENRPLSIDSGRVTLTHVELRGHASGAIGVRAARLSLVESGIHGNSAHFGAALQVRHCTHASIMLF